jgi:hypothetical protein
LTKGTQFEANHLKNIWEASVGKHESDKQDIYGVILAILPLLSQKLMGDLFKLLQSLKTSEYDLKTLEFIKDFSVVTANVKKKKNYEKN